MKKAAAGWLAEFKVAKDASGRRVSLFKGKCHGSAKVKAVLVGGNWLHISNLGGAYTAIEGEGFEWWTYFIINLRNVIPPFYVVSCKLS